MSKISYQNIPVEYEIAIKKVLSVSDRFTIPAVRVQRLISRRKALKGVTQRSLLPAISLAWSALTTLEKNAWNVAGFSSYITGYKCFVREYCLRIKYSLDPFVEPSPHHQGKVGYLQIASPASSLIIEQDHPRVYYVMKKEPNKKNMYSPVLVTELTSFPFHLYISYRSILTAYGANPIARLEITFISNYQGRDIETIKYIDFTLMSAWATADLEVVSIFGKFRFYKVRIILQDVRGDFYFDNFKLFHSGRNWARDTECNDIHQDFTRSYYQVAKHWIADDVGDGANFESVYPY